MLKLLMFSIIFVGLSSCDKAKSVESAPVEDEAPLITTYPILTVKKAEVQRGHGRKE